MSSAWETRVWVPHPSLGFAPARVMRSEEGFVVVEASDGQILQVAKHLCSPIHPNSLTGVPDLLELGEFSLAALLHNVRTRYEKGEYYSSIGLPILISVNPYKPLPHLYDCATRRRYQSAQFLLLSPPSTSRSPDHAAPLLFTDNPHLFGTAQMTYTSLMRNQQAQSIVVSGESGAGKTEATKILLRYFSELDDNPSLPNSNSSSASAKPFLTPKLVARSPMAHEHISIELHALRSNPVLEAFGNAKTLRNDNSSRFGKFIQIYFDLKNRRRIRKAKISHYLLEKCRLVSLHPSERNFHVFYALMYGGRRTYLHKLDQWDLLDDTPFQKMLGDEPIHEDHEVEMFEELMTCLSSTGFDQNEIDSMFGVVAALLHLSTVTFRDHDNKQAGFVPNLPLTTVDNLEPLRRAAELLGITQSPPDSKSATPLDSFIDIFTWGKVRDASGLGSTIPTKRDSAGATYVRDAIIKETYSRLFEWLVRKINFTLCLKEEAERRSMITSQAVRKASKLMESFSRDGATRSPVTSHVATSNQPLTTPPIGLLDIYGFEVFEGRNSFEQLCINYANEKLQQHFNHHVLSLEQKTYKEEGIDWSDILFTDNKHIIEALEGRLDGVFNLLDSATLAPSADQSYFLREVEATRHREVVQVLNARGQRRRFIVIKHYAGDVDYDTDQFVEKNKDKLSHECTYYLGCASTNTLVTQLFPALPSAIATRTNSLKATVSLEFRTQLSGLLASLTATTPTYVRCIKPNGVKAAHKFDSIDVLRQLKYAGLLESIRIRNSGFGVRCTFEEFLDKYALLDSRTRRTWRAQRRTLEVPERGRLCEQILAAILPLTEQPRAKRGGAKRAWQTGQTRVFMKEEVQIHLEKSRSTIMSDNATKIQSVWRGRAFQLAYQRSRTAIIRLQRSWRRSLQIRRLVKVWRNNVALIRIRQWTRWMLLRRRRRKAVRAVIKIQTAWRYHLATRQRPIQHTIKRETTKGSFKDSSTMESFRKPPEESHQLSESSGEASEIARPKPSSSRLVDKRRRADVSRMASKSRQEKYYLECDLFNLERTNQRKLSQVKADAEKYKSKLLLAQQQIDSYRKEIDSFTINLQKRESLLINLIQKNEEGKAKRILMLARLQTYRDALLLVEKIFYDLLTMTEEDRWRQTASQCPDLNGFMKYVRSCCYQARETFLQAEQSLSDPCGPPTHDYYYVDPFSRFGPPEMYDSEFEPSLIPMPSQSVYPAPPAGSCGLGTHTHAPRSKWRCYGPPADVMSENYSGYDYPRRHRYGGHRSSLSQQQHHSPTGIDEIEADYLQHVLSQSAPRRETKMSPPLHHHSNQYLNRYPMCSHDRSASRSARTPSHHERVLSCNVDARNLYRQNSSDEGSYHRCPPTYRPPKSGRPTPTHRVSNSLRLPPRMGNEDPSEALPSGRGSLPPSRALLHRRSSGGGGSSSEAGPARSPARATQTPLFVQPQASGGPFLILDGKCLAGRDAANPGSTTSSVKMRCVQKGYHGLSPSSFLRDLNPSSLSPSRSFGSLRLHSTSDGGGELSFPRRF